MSMNHGPPVLRKCRGRDAEITTQLVHERFDDRSDVARCGGIKGRTYLEVDLAGALFAQPTAGIEGKLDGIGGRNRARLKRDHDGVRVYFLILCRNVYA